MLLFLDTETTGVNPKSARLVQLAALLCEDTPECRQVASYNEIIAPVGFTIPNEAALIHRITTERARAQGVPLLDALNTLIELADRAGERMAVGHLVAHNLQYDYRILLEECDRAGIGHHAPRLALRPFCTMQSMSPICKLPPTERMRAVGRTHYKNPNLDEAWSHCYPGEDRDADDRHSAMGDVLRCRDVFVHGRKQGWWR